MNSDNVVSGFARGLRVVEAFGDAASRLSISEVAKLTGLDRATARRCLLTLSELGYAHYDGKFFTLTPKVLRLGQSYLAGAPLARIVQPFLDALSDEAGQSASVSVLDGTDIIYVGRAAQRRVMSISLSAGSRLPAYCASMGRIMLAALPERDAEALLRQSALQAKTEHTKVDVHEIMAELATARSQGYAIIDQELEVGLRSIAVPLVGKRGRVEAALNIGAAAIGDNPDRMAELYLIPLRRTARAISELLS
jgi:IclR family transcriptional regulator, pca regulon regulatory protein